MSAEAHTGGCQCGAVRFRANAIGEFSICHCRMCQKASGNLFAGFVVVQHKDLTWTRGSPSEFNSSDFAARGFCQACGTPLYYRFFTSDYNSISIGAFDHPDAIQLTVQYGIEGRHPSLVHYDAIRIEGTTESSIPEESRAISATNHQHPDHDTDDWPPKDHA